MRIHPVSCKSGLLVAAFLLGWSASASAQTFTWDGGGGDDNFGTGANWVGDGAPSVGSGVILNFSGSTRTTPNNNYTTGDNFGEWWLLSTAAADFTVTGNGFGLFNKIENQAGSGRTFTINTAGIYARDGSMELNPVGGNMIVGATVELDGNAALNVYDGSFGRTLTLNGALSNGNGSGGNGQLILNQTATVILAADSDYGGTTLNAGTTLRIGAGGTTGTLGVGNTANDGSLIFNRSSAYAYGSVISGTGTVTLEGGGTITLTGANSWSGATTVQQGTLAFSGAGTSNTAGTIAVNNGGTLRFDRHDTWGNHVTSATPVITINSGGIVQSNNSYTTLIGLVLNGGTLSANGGANVNYPAFGLRDTVTVNATAGGSAISTTGVGNFNTISIGNGAGTVPTTFSVADGAAAADLTVSVPLSNFSGVANSITKSGAGTMVLSGANTYTGSTLVTGGVLQVATGGSLTNNASITTRGGGRLDIAGTVSLGANQYLAAGNGVSGTTGEIRVLTGGALTVGNGAFLIGGSTSSNDQYGNGTFTQSGGTVTVAAGGGTGPDSSNIWLNPYGTTGRTATLNLDGGTFTTSRRIANGSGGTAIVNLNGGTLKTAAALTVFSGAMTVNVRNGGAIFDTNGLNSIVDKALTHSNIGGDNAIDGGLTKKGAGTLTLTAANTYTGNTLVNAGTLEVNGGTIPGPGLIDIGSVGNAANFTLTSGSVTAGSQFVIGAHGSTGAATINGGSLQVNGTIYAGGYGEGTGTGAITQTAGTVTSTGGVNFGGGGPNNGVYNLNGGTLTTTTIAKLGAGTATFNFNGGTLRPSATTASFLQGLTAANVKAGGAVIDSNTFNITIAQSLLHDSGLGATADGGLTKTGAGTLTLTSNASTYTGNVTVSQGTLALQAGLLNNAPTTTALGNPTTAGRTVTVAAGATLQFRQHDVLGNDAANPQMTFIVNGGTLAAATGNQASGNGPFNILPAVTLNGGTLTSANGAFATVQSFSLKGDITVTGTAPSTINTTGTPALLNGIHLTKSGGVNFDVADVTGSSATDLDVSAPLIGGAQNAVGALIKSGDGTMTLTAANTYSGSTTINAGTLEIGGTTGALTATSAINISGGTLLLGGSAADRIANGAAINLGGAANSKFAVSGNVTETLGAFTTLLSDSVFDAGSGAALLTFGSFTAGSGTLSVWNWTGTLWNTGGTDQLVFTSGVNGTFFSNVQFYSDGGSIPVGTGAQFLTTVGGVELVPVPEPGAALGALLLLVPAAIRESRRRTARGRVSS